MMNLSTNMRGLVCGILGFAFLCLGDAFVKKTALDYDTIYAGFFTNVFCIIALFIISIFNGGPKNFIRTKCVKLHIFRGFVMLGVYLTFLYAISRMPIAQAYTIMFFQPFILVILAYLLINEKMNAHRIGAILLGFIGVVFAFNPSLETINITALVALLSAFFFASVNIIVKFMDKTDHWMTYIFYVMLVQTPVLGGILIYNNGQINLPNLSSLPWLTIGGFAYAFGLALLPTALKKIDASVVGMMQYTGLIWGSLLGYLIFKEIPTINTIIGAIIIVFAGIYMMRSESRQNHDKTIE